MKCQTFQFDLFFVYFFTNYSYKGKIYDVTIATVIFSCGKITCYFHSCRLEVLTRKLTWYFIGVYIEQTDLFEEEAERCSHCCLALWSRHFGAYELQNETKPGPSFHSLSLLFFTNKDGGEISFAPPCS